MEQKDIDTQLFAHVTVHNMLLQQLTAAFLLCQEDRGELFIKQFLDGIRYKMRIPAEANTESGVDEVQMQSDAITLAENFFVSVRNRMK